MARRYVMDIDLIWVQLHTHFSLKLVINISSEYFYTIQSI